MKIIAKTLYGLEDELVNELQGLGADDVVRVNRAAVFKGDLELLYTVNYMSRCAVSVLMSIAEFNIRSADDLYNKGIQINWDRYIDQGNTFSINSVVSSPLFRHTGYAGLRLKDAIADYFRSRTGSRPSVDTKDPDIVINLHISNFEVSISLDSSGEPLFKRGYRRAGLEAPLNEVLAAGMIKLSGWNEKDRLIDPMCGSGTIIIEAAMQAANIPPGYNRKAYAFQKWNSYDKSLFSKVKSGFDSAIIIPEVAIEGSDISDVAVRQAIENCRVAGVSGFVRIRKENIKDLNPGDGSGTIIVNPPYGERLGRDETDSLYGMIGSVFKHSFPGYKAWIITSNTDSLKFIGLKPAKKHKLFNGSLECLFLGYDLYQGSLKGQRST